MSVTVVGSLAFDAVRSPLMSPRRVENHVVEMIAASGTASAPVADPMTITDEAPRRCGKLFMFIRVTATICLNACIAGIF